MQRDASLASSLVAVVLVSAAAFVFALACAQEPRATDQSSAAKAPEEWRTVTVGPVTAAMPAKNIEDAGPKARAAALLSGTAQYIDSTQSQSIDERTVVYQVMVVHKLFSPDSPLIKLYGDDSETYWIDQNLYGGGRASGKTIEETFRGSYADDLNARMGKINDGTNISRYLYFRQGDDFITVSALAAKNDFEAVQPNMDRFFRSVRVLH